tara:strand:+ start:185 stop:1150 length:966 start_codon:yes stop_codon:yes gene_type:complete
METFTSKISFIRKSFGETTSARDGVNVAVSCPSCGTNDKKRKFSINIKTWRCHCWVCGIKGKDPYNIIKKHISQDLAKEFRSRFQSYSSLEDKDIVKEDETISIPRGFIPLFLNTGSSDPDVRACISYLKSRNVTNKDLWYFKIGTCKSGKFRRRVIIPSFDVDGELNYFSGRSIDADIKYKYLNSRNKKTDIIFNHINIDWKKELTIVEGPFDLLKCNQNSTCILGSNLTKGSFLFKKIIANKTPVLLALDSDMKSKSIKIAESLIDYDCDVRILNLKSFSDVGEMTKADFRILSSDATMWTNKMSLMEKISSLRSGSLF